MAGIRREMARVKEQAVEYSRRMRPLSKSKSREREKNIDITIDDC